MYSNQCMAKVLLVHLAFAQLYHLKKNCLYLFGVTGFEFSVIWFFENDFQQFL